MKHRVLVIGVGSIGERHLRCLLQTGRADVAICEPNAALREAIGDRYAVGTTFAELSCALGARDFHAAIIATPAPSHVPLAMELARRGIHLLIEKPLSTTLEGLDDLKQRIIAKDVVAAVAYVYRSHPVLAHMRAEILSGRWGKPVQLVAVSGENFPMARPAYRNIYYADRKTGGGAIQDALTHTINAAEWLVGPIDALVADAAHQVLDGVEVEDTVHMTARHNAVLASYSLNQYQNAEEWTLTVACERAVARFEGHNNRWLLASEPKKPWVKQMSQEFQRDTLFELQAHAFLDAIERKRPVTCDLEAGIQSLRASLAALRSLENADRFTKP